MSLPEISRRCLACGAAVRAGARFCPQCGRQMGDEAAAPQQSAAAEEGPASGATEQDGDRAAPATRENEAPREWTPATKEWTPPTREFEAFIHSVPGAGEHAGAERSAEARADGHAAAPAQQAQTTQAHAAQAYAEPQAETPASPAPEVWGAGQGEAVAEAAAESAGTAESRGRVARVREAGRARVERMREEAIVVLEETPDDSGFRFVVAAAALFLVTVLLFVLSVTVLR